MAGGTLPEVRPATLRFRLLLAIGLILVVCQVISVLWLWHESKEQIQLLVEAALNHRDVQRSVQREIREAIASLALPSLVIITLSLLLCRQAIKWITRPLSDLQQELERRGENNLEPVPFQPSVSEIDAVTLAINRLVSRLTVSLERERLFTADVAHELRTPLAGLRLHLELIERKHHIDVRPLIERLDQMTHSVSQLLQLARVGHAFTAGNYQHVSLLLEVFRPMQQELQAMLDDRQQTLIIDPQQEALVRGDATLLRLVLRNLVENAHRYSPPGSRITVGISAEPEPTLTVSDEGPGIDDSKRGELSKAFVRMDSRYGGIGLGLSIVTRIVQLHKGAFHLDNRTDGRGCQARVVLTAAADGPPPP
ncbi:two-component system sensor histidine kinase PmrB [Erwinia sp. B116]|uniref:two-component system sensor histidine kinase PmrB n=1 Tax=Erwinia sp. B116 TaxID=1561024 RepID=UPI000C75ABC0|nr:two-component system sensor histidine kinase PmrB [Erwinia sp. B116]